MKAFCRTVVSNPWFERFIVGIILVNALVLGLETSSSLSRQWGSTFELIYAVVLGIFVLEAVMKIYAVAPQYRRYFGDGWNVFDFSIVVLSLLPSSGPFAMIARVLRLLRVLRLVSVIPELRLIVETLVRSIPGMGHVLMLMSVIFYIYAVAGFHLFSSHDPTHWGSLGISLLTLFRVVTLEDWTDVMYTAMELHPLAWIYFVSFVVMGTFVIINLFIAVVLNNLEEAKLERLRELEQPASRKEILSELKQTQAALGRMQQRLEKMDLDRLEH